MRPAIYYNAFPSNCFQSLVPPARGDNAFSCYSLCLFPLSVRFDTHVCRIKILKCLRFVSPQKSSLPGATKWQEIKDSFVCFPRSSERAGPPPCLVLVSIPVSIPVSPSIVVQTSLLPGIPFCLSYRFTSTATLWVGGRHPGHPRIHPPLPL